MKKLSKKSCVTSRSGRKKSKSPSPSKPGKAAGIESKKINSRAKGCRGELDLVHFLKERGIDARRGQQFAGGTDSPDVIALGILSGFHLEVKNTERANIYGWLEQACTDADLHKVPVVAHKRNGKRWVAIVDMRDFINLLEERGRVDYAAMLKAVTP